MRAIKRVRRIWGFRVVTSTRRADKQRSSGVLGGAKSCSIGRGVLARPPTPWARVPRSGPNPHPRSRPMADNPAPNGAQAEDAPQLNALAQYAKDLSFENPN